MEVPLGVVWSIVCWCFLQTEGQSLSGSSRPVVASLGDHVVLPCLFQPLTDVSGLTLEWSRPDLEPRFVFVWRSHEELTKFMNSEFTGRASLFKDELKHGNISLRLSTVRVSDGGIYRCSVPGLSIATSVELHVVVRGSPAVVSVAAVHVWRPAVELQCESGAWYPQPELWWLDSEGDLLSAEHSLTLPGPEGLYTISSRLRVEHRGTYTCRVTQSSTHSSTQHSVRLTDGSFGVDVWILPLVVALAAVVALAVLLFLYFRLKRSHSEILKLQSEDHDQDWLNLKTGLEEQVQALTTDLVSSKRTISDLEEENVNLRSERFEVQTQLKTLTSEKTLYKKLLKQRHVRVPSESVMIHHFDQTGFILKNNSSEVQQLMGWSVVVEVDDAGPLIYAFENTLILKIKDDKNTVKVWADGCGPEGRGSDGRGPGGGFYKERTWEDQAPWTSGDSALVSLYDRNKQLVDVICQRLDRVAFDLSKML